MSGVQIADAKAPFVRFDVREEEDRAASVKAGRYIAKDVIYAVITPHGSKDEIDRVAEEWLDNMDVQAREGRLDPKWAKSYRHAFEEFKAGRAIPLEGTPIANWPMVSPAQVRNLQNLHILTVEVLAEANEQTIGRLGMGGRDLVAKAKNFLAQVKGPGQAASQITALEQQVVDLKAAVEKLTNDNAMLQAAVNANRQQAPVQEPGIGVGDLFDNDSTLRKL